MRSVRHRRRRYRSNPSPRELGALIITTAITAGVGAIVVWWITGKLKQQEQPPQQPPPQLPPPQTYDERGSYWA